MSASKLVTIYGGSGFLGRQIARVMAAQGWRIRVAVRNPNLSGGVRTYGVPGQLEPVLCNVRDDRSVLACMADADAVINCVGVSARKGRNSFDAINNEAAGRIARLAAQTGVKHFVHISALGADPESDSRFAASKGEGEIEVLKHRPDAVILRPSIIFGSDDSFFNGLAARTTLGPVMLVPMAKARVQPVYVGDVAQAASLAASGEAAPGIYELGGPDVFTMREAAKMVLEHVGRRRIVFGLPHWLSGIAGSVLDAGQTLSMGLVPNKMMSRDQMRSVKRDVSVSSAARGLSDLGIQPTSAAAVIPEYLWRFRRSGQYDAITETAKNLRQS